MDLTIAERVQNGVDRLDVYGPRFWRDSLDFETFDILSRINCVLGQVFGDWDAGTREIQVSYDRRGQEACGFELTPDEYESASVYEIAEQFKEEWSKHV